VVTNGYGMPSKYEANVQRRQSPGLTPQPQASISFTPLQNLFGIITPSGVHFERHHSGMPEVDPEQHRLMIHGLVKRPLMLTMDDVMRFPSVSRIHFIECGANGGMEWANVAVPTVQYTHGMIACSEFTACCCPTLLDEAGVDRAKGKFVLAEGADGSALTRTIPMEFALNDVMVVYGQNGEMLRPENGYPVAVASARCAGSVKREVAATSRSRRQAMEYARRVAALHRSVAERTAPSVLGCAGSQIGDHDALGRTDARRSAVITRSPGSPWSGRGKVKRVDVSVDGGRNWRTARLQEPVLTKALTRFRLDWTLER
jgi:sulfane dehydrogenase subunit SoxC